MSCVVHYSALFSLIRVPVFQVALGLACQRRLKAEANDVPPLRAAKRAVHVGLPSIQRVEAPRLQLWEGWGGGWVG